LKNLNKCDSSVSNKQFDPWGYNLSTHKKWVNWFSPFYQHYFQVETSGLDNIPNQGRVLIIANHSGQLPIDGMLIGHALATRSCNPRSPRAMIERFFPKVPFLGNFINAIGGVVGDPLNCKAMLNHEEAIMVFPEGAGGSGKPWSKRYQLQRFGLGFMHLAIETNTPIIPVGVVGCEETMPTLFHLNWLAKKVGVPYLPVTIPIPLPIKVRLNFGSPMIFENSDDKTEADIERHVALVKAEISSLIKIGLAKRKGSI